jgi:hypothetical protein
MAVLNKLYKPAKLKTINATFEKVNRPLQKFKKINIEPKKSSPKKVIRQ